MDPANPREVTAKEAVEGEGEVEEEVVSRKLYIYIYLYMFHLSVDPKIEGMDWAKRLQFKD